KSAGPGETGVVPSPASGRRAHQPTVARLPKTEPVYVSIDIDVLDLPLVPGCASSEVNGLSYDELRQTLFAIARSREVIGFDLVEVNPMLDVASDNTSLIAAQLIIEFLARIVEHPGYRKRHPKREVAGLPTNGRGRVTTAPAPTDGGPPPTAAPPPPAPAPRAGRRRRPRAGNPPTPHR